MENRAVQAYNREASVYRKLEAIATRLQQDAYEQEAAKHKVKQFNPCPKGTYITARMGQPDAKIMPILEGAALEHCACHNDFGLSELLGYLPK